MSEKKYHKTAGGVVLNAAGHFLVLVRDVERDGALKHEVRLPKGHVDPGETDEQAARREVHEESGYGGTKVVADLGRARSEFEFRGHGHIRDEHYFLMRLVDGHRDAPQPTHADEARFEPRWLDPHEAVAALTYASEQDFARRAIAALHTGA